jgi:hypothetical protein
MTAAQRALRTAAWSAAGGFAFGWTAKTLASPPPRLEPLPALVAVAPQNLPTKAPEGGVVTSDGRVVTPLNAPDPASLVLSPSDPCADRPRPRRK